MIAELQTEDRGIELPASAVLIRDDGSTSVMIYEPSDDASGVLRTQPVDLTAGPDGEFILQGGLEDGVEIVVAGVSRLTDGQAARRFEGLSN